MENMVKVKKVLSPRYNKSIARINTLSYGGNKLSQVTLAVRKFGKAVSLSSFPPEGRGGKCILSLICIHLLFVFKRRYDKSKFLF